MSESGSASERPSRDASGDEETPPPPPSGMAALLVAPRHFSSGDDEEDGHEDEESAGSEGGMKGKQAATKMRVSPEKKVLPTLDAWLMSSSNSGSRQEVEPSPAPSHASSVSNTPLGTPSTTPSPKKRKRKQQVPPVETVAPSVVTMEEMDVSVDTLRQLATKRGLDVSSLASWQRRADGRLVDGEQRVYKSVRDALRALAYAQTGRVPREDIYFLAILRRQLAQAAMPFQDGPIQVTALGRTIPKELFYSQKKLFPVGFEAMASVKLVKASDAKIRLHCKIVEGNNQKSPIFVVSAARDEDVMFRSYVASKAWKKALGHFESLPAEELAPYLEDAAADDEQTEYLSSSAGEDGFGLLRRNITRILEGGHQVLLCADYQFWEERHPVSPEAHAKLRSRLMKEVKEALKGGMSKDDLKRLMSQDIQLADHEKSPEQLEKDQQRKERERRDAEKQSVREAARKLLEIELKAQEDAKEAQRKEREDRKNALLEAKMEIVRQREAKKEATRREKEEERRMREEEKEMRKFMKEEERRRKVEEKEMHMQRKIDELRERRKMREQQRSIVENGVDTGDNGTGMFRSTASPSKRNVDSERQSIEKRRTALLKFVREERERRRRLRLWERRRTADEAVWNRVKVDYSTREGCYVEEEESIQAVDATKAEDDGLVPRGVFTRVAALDHVPAEVYNDIVFAWDTISTFSDVLQMPFVPPLSIFAGLLVQATAIPSATGAEKIQSDEKSAAADRSVAAIQISVLKVLLAEYFPFLQMGTTLDEFLRTRPLNLYTWPELTRQVCLLALDVAHPSMDDQVVKALKGSRSSRDDPFLLPLRQRIQDRGEKLLAGEMYEDVEAKDDDSLGLVLKTGQRDGNESKTLPAAATTHYGVVADEGMASLFRVDKVDGSFVVSELLFEKKGDQGAGVVNELDAEKINVGDHIVALNGQPVGGIVDLQAFAEIVATIPAPHGLLMSTVPPTVKPAFKHIPTTQSANKLKRCAHVLKVLRSKELAGPFNQPVDIELYPDYFTAVPEPMDLGTIQEKIEDEEYENDDDVEAFVDDVNLVWKNCYVYNSLKAEISLMAKKLSAIFDRLMEEWVETDVVRPLISVEEDHCRKCRTNQVRDRLLLCDRCDASYHTFCLAPPLKKVPSGEWYCPRCIADPSFAPDLQKKKASEGERDGGQQAVEVIEYTDLEKKLLQVLEYLSKDDVSQLTLTERVSVLRVSTELLIETGAVQDLYRSLEEKANALRKECGESLADLEQSWKDFAPPKTGSGIDRTARFIIDGIDHELTDELLDFIEEKTLAERDGRPTPEFPASMSAKPQLELLEDGEDSDAESTASDDDEAELIEELGDMYLASTSTPEAPVAHEAPAPTCRFCALEDGIVNGSLRPYKLSPINHIITEMDDFELPAILTSEEANEEDAVATRPHLLEFHELPVAEAPSVRLVKTPSGFGYASATKDASATTLYAVNDCLVADMSRDEIQHAIRASKTPVRLYSFVDSAHAVLHASVSIVSFKASGEALGIDVGTGHGGFMFVRSLKPDSVAELSEQVFPGDVLWMIDGLVTFGRAVEEVQALLYQEPRQDMRTKSLVLVRAPSTRMKRFAAVKSWSTNAVAVQRAKLSELMTQVTANPVQQRTTRQLYDVTFQHGPLGLALSLEDRVMVKSLNDNADGTPGQASLSGTIQPGDVIERVNGKPYGSLRDLSQFTASLVTLPRPIVITFSKEVPVVVQHVNDPASANPFSDKKKLGRALGMQARASMQLKTLCVDVTQLTSLPLTIEDFGIHTPTIVSMTNRILCNKNDESGDELKVGDCFVGVNGVSTAGLPWEAVSRVLFQIRGPVYMHFVARVRVSTMFQAHDACVRQANAAYSEAEYLIPKLEAAKQTEAFIRRIVPRSSCLGKCSNGYSYYHFHGDMRELYAKSSGGQWFTVGAGHTPAVRKLLTFLEGTENPRDLVVADNIRAPFCLRNPSGNSTPSSALAVIEPFMQSEAFAVSTEVTSATSENGAEMEKYDAWLSYLGRKYLVGSFASRQDADATLKLAEQLVRTDGTHTLPSTTAPSALLQRIPTLPTPVLKAEMVVRRLFQRRYEYGNVVDASGNQKRVPMSQSIVQDLRGGLQSGGSHLGYGSTSSSGGMLPGSTLAQQNEMLKRKAAEAMLQNENAMRQRSEAQKRARPQSAQHMPQPSGPYPSPQASSAAKRQLQPLADQGRSMLTAWNNYARAPTPSTTHGLAFACLTSFEEVKKATTRLLSDPTHPVPDVVTFVSLHHAYVVGLICAMTAQALTNSQRSQGDSQMVKTVADAFATALLCCIEASPALRSRAMGGFAAAVKQCDRTMRPRDLSEPLHHIANFVAQFVQVSRYLASGSFDDLMNCRPVVSDDPRAMEMLPASFVQQIRLLENVRRAYVTRLNSGAVPPVRPNSASPSGSRLSPGAEQYTQVDFGPGPLGIMINYSARGKVVVTEYSNDRGQPGQAQASGKVAIGDEVYAINGRLVEAIGGMEGFKAFVGSGQRPIRVTFKKTAESSMMPMRSSGEMNPTLRRPSPQPTAPMAYGYAQPQGLPDHLRQQQQQQQQPQQQQPQLQPLQPIPLAPSGMNAQQMLYQNGGLPQSMPRPMYPQPGGGPVQQGFGSMPPYQTPSGPGGYDMMPAMYDGAQNANLMPAPLNWQPPNPPPQQQSQLQPQTLPSFNPQPMHLNARNDGNGPTNSMRTPPQFPRSSASMGFPSPPDLGGMNNRSAPAPVPMPMPTGQYGAPGGFVAANDPNLADNEANSISYFDANGTTFRSTPDFEIDTTATSTSSVIADETSTVDGDGNESILDMDTEEESDREVDSADGGNSGSISQMTTPANSDVESDANNRRVDGRSPSRPAPASASQLLPPRGSSASAPATVEKKPTKKSTNDEDSSVEVVDVEQEDMTLSMARRSARVPRKITTNIGDMYNPELNGSNARGSSSRTASGGGAPGRGELVEPTHGEVGELATELLEGFQATIRSGKRDAACPTLRVLRAQLFAIEAAIPREAFRAGRWSRAIRAAWSEMVYSTDSASMVLEATLFLETNLENEWLESFWKSSSVPTARYALSTATTASAAMRLYSLDDAITYVRAKRGGGGRRKQTRPSGSEQSSPVKAPVTVDLTASSGSTAMHPGELAFVAKLPPGVVAVANRIVDRILVLQREKTPNAFVYRKALRELIALTDLTENQIEQWIRAAANHAQQLVMTSLSQSGGLPTASSMRQPTPKRKLGAAQPPAVAAEDQRPSRKRKLVSSGPSVSLPCYQTQSESPYRLASPSDRSLKPRLELIVATLLKNELAMPFAAPVNPRDVPGYTDIIEQPMDLGTIQQRLARGYYDNRLDQVAHDVDLVWTNCFHFNRLDAEISKCANRLRSIFNRLFEHWIASQAPGTPLAALPSEEACRQCLQTHASDRMLLCDSCDAAYHLFCLSPPLEAIPEGDWYCPRCPIQQLTLPPQ